MALRVKIDPIDKSVEAEIRSDLSRAAQAKAAAAFAQEGFREADDQNRSILGRHAPHTRTVDGREGAPLESVNPNGGTIIFEWEIISDVLMWIATTLIQRSPVVSGAYRSGHTLFADDVEVPVSTTIPPAEEYVLTNFVPYARKIEVGKTKSGRSFVMQVPNRIYERTAKDARARFGNIAKIEFAYRSVRGGAVGSWAGSASARRHAGRTRRGNPTKHMEWLTRQPAIVVTQLGGLKSASGVT